MTARRGIGGVRPACEVRAQAAAARAHEGGHDGAMLVRDRVARPTRDGVVHLVRVRVRVRVWVRVHLVRARVRVRVRVRVHLVRVRVRVRVRVHLDVREPVGPLRVELRRPVVREPVLEAPWVVEAEDAHVGARGEGLRHELLVVEVERAGDAEAGRRGALQGEHEAVRPPAGRYGEM